MLSPKCWTSVQKWRGWSPEKIITFSCRQSFKTYKIVFDFPQRTTPRVLCRRWRKYGRTSEHWKCNKPCAKKNRLHKVKIRSVWTVQMMERMEPLSDTGLCLQDLVSGVATSSSATSGSSESSVAHNHHQHTNHHHHHAAGHEAIVPAVSAVSVSSAAAGIMSAGSAVLGLNHHHHVSAAVHDSVSHHHVQCTPTVLHHEPLEKLKRGE